MKKWRKMGGGARKTREDGMKLIKLFPSRKLLRETIVPTPVFLKDELDASHNEGGELHGTRREVERWGKRRYG